MCLEAALRLPDDHPARKDLPPLGHELALWLNAMTTLDQRLRKDRLPAPVGSYLQRWLPQAPTPAPLPLTFSVCLTPSLQLQQGPLAAFNHPIWRALLHLPALRDFWTLELRASHFQHLLQIIPRTWCVSPEPVPPGAVIAGLNISSWDQLPEQTAEGRRLHRQTLESGDEVIVTDKEGEFIEARYHQNQGRIVLQDAFARALS